MRTCHRIKKYEGTKSEKIQQMINDKIIQQMKKEKLPKLRNDEVLNDIYKQYKKAKKKYYNLKEMLKKRKEILNIEWIHHYSEKRGDWYAYNIDFQKCYVPEKVKEKLQQASNLYSLGKYEKARKI